MFISRNCKILLIFIEFILTGSGVDFNILNEKVFIFVKSKQDM